MRPDQYDPRIAMVAGLRPAPPPRVQRRWPRVLALLVGLPVMFLVAIGVTVYVLGSDPLLPRLERYADYRPATITRLFAATGDPIGEVVGARRTVLPLDRMPPKLEEALIARREPSLSSRGPMSLVQLGRGIALSAFGTAPPEPLSLGLARSLMPVLSDLGVPRLIKEWVTAFRLERHLSRRELVNVYLNQVSFGPGVYGVEEAAQASFQRSAAQLDAEQLGTLLSRAASDRTAETPALTTHATSGCAAEAIRRLGDRFDRAALGRLGARVTTPCDPALGRVVDEAIHKQHLERSNLSAVVIVAKVPSQEVTVLTTGDDDDPEAAARAANSAHPMALLRVPVVVSAALDSLKFNLSTPMDRGEGHEPLRELAIRDPAGAADALMAAGLGRSAVADVATRLGLRVSTAEELLSGQAPVSALEIASMYGALAANGQRRALQLWTQIDGKPESEAARAPMQAVSPEIAFLLGSISPVSSAMRARIKQTWGGFYANSGKQTWVAVSTSLRVVVVWIGARDEGGVRPGIDAGKAALAIAGDVLVAAHKGLHPEAFERPAGLVARRVDAATGRLLKPSEEGGVEEWFLPRSLPKEDPELPPE